MSRDGRSLGHHELRHSEGPLLNPSAQTGVCAYSYTRPRLTYMPVCCEQSLSSLFVFTGHVAPPVYNTGRPIAPTHTSREQRWTLACAMLLCQRW